jgi:hypothetical protein
LRVCVALAGARTVLQAALLPPDKMSMSASPWLTGDASRATRVKVQMTLTILSLGLFIFSLFLPAVRVAEPDSPIGIPVTGLACAMTSPTHYASNVFCLAIPAVCARLRSGRRAAPQLLFAAIGVASFFVVALTPMFPPAARTFFANSLVFEVGFTVWVVAHALAAVALLIPVWGVDTAREEADRAYAHLRKKWLPNSVKPAR